MSTKFSILLCFIIKVWTLVGDIDRWTTCWIFVFVTVKKLMPMEWTGMAVNSAESKWSIDFCQYRNDVCQVMASFSEMALLTSFYICNSTCIINWKCSCACLLWSNVIRPKPDLPDCLLWPCDVYILTTMWLRRGIAEKWVWFTCITESRIVDLLQVCVLVPRLNLGRLAVYSCGCVKQYIGTNGGIWRLRHNTIGGC